MQRLSLKIGLMISIISGCGWMDQGSGQRHESDGGGVRQEGAQGEAQERGALQRVPECGGQRQILRNERRILEKYGRQSSQCRSGSSSTSGNNTKLADYSQLQSYPSFSKFWQKVPAWNWFQMFQLLIFFFSLYFTSLTRSLFNWFNRKKMLLFRRESWGPAQRRYSSDTEDIGDTFTDLTRRHLHPHLDGDDDHHLDLAHGR